MSPTTKKIGHGGRPFILAEEKACDEVIYFPSWLLSRKDCLQEMPGCASQIKKKQINHWPTDQKKSNFVTSSWKSIKNKNRSGKKNGDNLITALFDPKKDLEEIRKKETVPHRGSLVFWYLKSISSRESESSFLEEKKEQKKMGPFTFGLITF